MYNELGLSPKAGIYISVSTCLLFKSVSIIPLSGVREEETTFARYLIKI